MRKKVAYAENGVILILADINRNGGSVLTNDYAVECKRNCCPLVSLDSAIVMSLKEGKLFVLIKRIGFKVKAGRINMRSGNMKTLLKRTASDFCKKERFVAVIYIYFIARNIFFTGFKWNKALFFKHRNTPVYKLTLGFAGAYKVLIGFAIIIGFGYFFLGESKPGVFRRTEKFFLKKLTRSFFRSWFFLLYVIYFYFM